VAAELATIQTDEAANVLREKNVARLIDWANSTARSRQERAREARALAAAREDRGGAARHDVPAWVDDVGRVK
jgi:hypothetical protein